MEHEILHADARLRRTTVVVLAVAALLLAIAVVAFHRWFSAASEATEVPTLILHVRAMTGLALMASAMCLAALAWHSARSARRTRASGQWPPLGARVVRDTPILRGDAARRRATLLTTIAVLLTLLTAGVAAIGMRLLSLLG